MTLLEKDFTLAALRKDVGPLSDYEKSPTGLQAQISKKYGVGIHMMIPNTRNVGVGKGKSYCTLTEWKEHGLKVSDIDLENIFGELEYFMKPIQTKNIFQF